jgi:hypothetical protein
MPDPKDKQCPKCRAHSGDDWKQCHGSCPMEISPHYDPEWKTKRNNSYGAQIAIQLLETLGRDDGIEVLCSAICYAREHLEDSTVLEWAIGFLQKYHSIPDDHPLVIGTIRKNVVH